MTTRTNESEAGHPLDPSRVAICAGTRVQLASAGGDAVPQLLQAWEGQPSVRHGVIVTFGMMLWYADSTARTLSSEHRLLARQYLLRAAVAEESWLRKAFVEAAEWTHDATYLPLVQGIDAAGPGALKLQRQLQQTLPGELISALREQFEVMVTEGWIPDDGLVRSLRGAFQTAVISYAGHDTRTARATLTAAQVNVGQAKGRGIRPEGWTLLSEGIAMVLLRSGAA